MQALDTGEKLAGTDDKLFPLPLQHHGGLAGRQRRTSLKHVQLAAKRYLLPWTKALQPLMICLRLNFFHNPVPYHIDDESLNPQKLTSRAPAIKVTAMRIAVMGAGAVGGYFGARLALAGHDLTFIGRGSHLAAMRESGLRIHSPNGDIHIEHAVFCEHAGETAADLVLVCVKSYDTETAAKAIAPMVRGDTMVVSLQNGIGNTEKLATLWGSDRIFAGVVYIAAQLVSPGVIRHSNGGRIIFGSPTGAGRPAAERIAQTLSAAGISCAVSADIATVQWSKLLWNAPFCAISCLTRATPKQIVECEPLTRLATDCMAEVQAAASTRDVKLPRKLFDEAIAFSRTLGEFEPSMLQDLRARKRLEYEALNGVVVRLLKETGQTAPVNQVFYELLQQLDRTNREEAVSSP